MSQFNFNAENLTEMKSFYQEELIKALSRLNHINDVLSQLGAEGTQVEMTFAGVKSVERKSKRSAPKRKYNKKRGPKSRWDKVIVKTITKADRPLTYDDITDFLMISEGRDAAQRKNMKATVQNTVFRLRKDKKIRTFSMGARTKYIAPKNWFDESGDISQEYKAKVKLPAASVKPAPSGEKRKPGRPRKIQAPAAKAKATENSSTKPAPKTKSVKKTTPKTKAVKKTSPKTKAAKKTTPKKKTTTKQAPKAKAVAAAASPSPKPSTKQAPKAKAATATPAPKTTPKAKPATPKKKAANSPKPKAKAKPAKKSAPKKVSTAKASPVKKATPKKKKKKKSTTPAKKSASATSATKSPAAAKPKQSKSKAKKTVAPGPRKLAMTKTVKLKKKKK